MLDYIDKSRIKLDPLALILNVIDRFLPEDDYESFDGINRRRRCRLVVGISGLAGFFCLSITAISRTLNGEFDASDPFTIFVGCLVLLNPIIMQKSGRPELAGWLFIVEICSLLTLLCLLLGGLFAPNALFLILMPLVGAFFVNRTAGVVTSLIAVVGVTCFYLFDTTIQEWSVLNQASYGTIYYVCILFAILLCVGIAWLFEQTQTTTTAELKAMIEQLRSAHADLVVARNDAEAASRAKSEFLATMSHEIRTPLNGVIGMTGLLLDTPLSTEQQEFTDVVRTSGESLLTIINDILDFSKIEAGKIELEETSFSLRNCVEEALDLVTVKANQKSIELLYQLSADVPNRVTGDVTRLRQILLNLLSNAVKFTDEGEIVVSIEAESNDVHSFNGLDASNGEIGAPLMLHFQVRDTGVGIPSDRRDRLFKSFSQVDASTTRQYGGTGLGLAISKRLCELMGGTMWVESQLGQGSTFHFSVLLTRAVDDSTLHSTEDVDDLAGLNVLLIDDNVTNLQILTKQLASWKINSTAVESGADALKLLKQKESFQLVITDMQMPKMDGLMIAEKIRTQYSPAELPIILLTSIGHIAHSRWEAGGICKTITKPIKTSHLMDAIAQAVRPRTPTSANHRQLQHPDPVLSTNTSQLLGSQYPLRILLAEDNLVNQRVAIKMLERSGYRADLAADGQEAVDALQRQPYDLVFMDVRMPNMDGIQATEAIRRKFSANRQPVIVAMTAEALQGDKERLLEAGMDDYLSKPVKPAELARLLRTVAEQINNASAVESNYPT